MKCALSGHLSPSDKLYWGHVLVQIECFFFRVWGSCRSQFFSIHARGVFFELADGLDEVAPIWKRDKTSICTVCLLSSFSCQEGNPSFWTKSKEALVVHASLNILLGLLDWTAHYQHSLNFHPCLFPTLRQRCKSLGCELSKFFEWLACINRISLSLTFHWNIVREKQQMFCDSCWFSVLEEHSLSTVKSTRQCQDLGPLSTDSVYHRNPSRLWKKKIA